MQWLGSVALVAKITSSVFSLLILSTRELISSLPCFDYYLKVFLKNMVVTLKIDELSITHWSEIFSTTQILLNFLFLFSQLS